MNKLSVMLSMLTLVSLSTCNVIASSVGGGIYVPVQHYQPASACQTGQCRPGNTCSHCAGLGLASVDGATMPPCAASGTCKPKSDTYGYYPQKWRSWPGEEGDSEPEPTLADEEVIDPPAPEKEDLQAPPPIEDSVEAAIEATQPAVEPLDIQLPALPKQAPANPKPLPVERPAPINPPAPGREAPPVLPFGWKAPVENNNWQTSKSADEIVTWVEEKPKNGQTAMSHQTASPGIVNANLIESRIPQTTQKASSKKAVDGPPVLPTGLLTPTYSQKETPTIRRLPSASGHRVDGRVVPTSAVQ